MARLKFKCLITIVSLLEGADNGKNGLISLVVRSLPTDVLTNNLLRIYELFKKYETQGYIMEVFGRDEEEIEEED